MDARRRTLGVQVVVEVHQVLPAAVQLSLVLGWELELVDARLTLGVQAVVEAHQVLAPAVQLSLVLGCEWELDSAAVALVRSERQWEEGLELALGPVAVALTVRLTFEARVVGVVHVGG